jgi:tryptophan-rich sensory protein
LPNIFNKNLNFKRYIFLQYPMLTFVLHFNYAFWIPITGFLTTTINILNKRGT